MTNDELVERVARAIYEGRNGRGCKAWAHLPKSHQQPYLEDGSAAISTISEALQELDANQEQAGFFAAFDSVDMLDGEPFVRTDVAQRVVDAVLTASPLNGGK